VIPEIKTTRPGQSFPWLLFSSGRPLFMFHMGIRYRSLLKSLRYYHLDNFTTAAASYLIRKRKINLLFLHLLDLDGTRHRYGFRASEVEAVLEDQDRRLGLLLAASRESGSFSETAFIVFGDHAYRDVHTRIRINAAFREAGLLAFDRKGKLVSWQAWANCCEGSTQVTLYDRRDRATHRTVTDVFARLQKKPQGVVKTVYTREQVERMKVGEHVDYILEARDGCYFVPEIAGPVIAPAEEWFRAVHGYHPDQPGYSSVFLAAGAGVRRGVEMDPFRIVDVGPTLAILLGLNLPDAEGRVLTEILEE